MTRRPPMRLTPALLACLVAAAPAAGNERPDEACAEAADILVGDVVRRHIRRVGSPREMEERGRRAFERLLERLAGAGASFRTEAWRVKPILWAELAKEGEDVRLNCSLMAQIARELAASSAVPQADVVQLLWDDFIHFFLTEMDPHSGLFRGPQAVALLGGGSGKRFLAAGVSAIQLGGMQVVTSVHPKSPAEEAGLRVGDIILRARIGSWEYTFGKGASIFWSRLARTDPGQAVELTVLSPDGGRRTVSLRRKMLRASFTQARLEKSGILYVRISEFAPGLSEEFRRRVRPHLRKTRALVLDLRFNPGGSLLETLEILDFFVREGPLLFLWKRAGVIARMAEPKPREFPPVPMVVLVNGLTASAAEIVALALGRDNHARAIVVGGRTWGKGSVFGLRRMGEERVLLVTDALYVGPDGSLVQGSGFEPDIPVEDPLLEKVWAKLDEIAPERVARHEGDLPFAIPAMRRIDSKFLAPNARISDANSVEKLLTYLPPEARTPSAGAPDPALAVATEILLQLVQRCATYRAESCK